MHLKRIASKVDKAWEKELKESLARLNASRPKAFHSKRFVKPRPKCEHCGRDVFVPTDFLCSDRCADAYWKEKRNER